MGRHYRRKRGRKHTRARRKNNMHIWLVLAAAAILALGVYFEPDSAGMLPEVSVLREMLPAPQAEAIEEGKIPAFSGKPYLVVNENRPYFSPEEYTFTSFERYSDLDALGRCGVAYACVGKDLMPKEERGTIGQIKPSGWQTIKFDQVDGKYLYNRCHLIGYQLSGENANEKNLITGTRYLNVEGMLPFENQVADYVLESGNHVLYRVTPVFEGNNLLATGVLMEAYSVEDYGGGICFCVFCYNSQPGITIDYSTGRAKLSEQDKNN